GKPASLLGDPEPQRLRADQLAAGADGQDLGRRLVRPIQRDPDVQPAVRVIDVQAFDRLVWARPDDASQPVEPVTGDPQLELHARRIPFVSGARFGPERGEVELLRALEDLVERLDPADARHAVGPRLAVDAGDQVPDAGLQDEPEWLEDPIDG